MIESRKMGRHIDHWMDKLDQDLIPPASYRFSRSRIMFIECKSEGLEGPAVIGRVYFSKSGKTIYIHNVAEFQWRFDRSKAPPR